MTWVPALGALTHVSHTRYSVYIGGRLAYWEDINGDRQLRPTGYKATIEDTFGIYTQESSGCVLLSRRTTTCAASSHHTRHRGGVACAGCVARPLAERKKIPLKRTLGFRTMGTGQIMFVIYDLPILIERVRDRGPRPVHGLCAGTVARDAT